MTTEAESLAEIERWKHNGELRMHAYYYAFEPTGVEAIDRILSAVAISGKKYHNTVEWSDTCCDLIQAAANEAARVLKP